MIDWDRISELQEEVGEEGVAEVIDIFLEEMDEGIAALSNLTAASDIAEKLHFLKGSAQNIGLSHASALCQTFEERIKADPSAFPDVASLRSSLDAARGELGAFAG